jgi:hypothetical protein
MSAEFTKIISDFVKDILITFPEYSNIISKWWSLAEGATNDSDYVFKHCVKAFKDHFFHILNKNVDIFADESLNTEFLPGIVFKYIWKCDISDSTRETIWKYLQLILFAIVGELHGHTSEEGAAAKNMFSGINETEFKDKLTETFEQMKTLFENQPNSPSGETERPDLDEHVKQLMKGKLGKLAMEFAQDTVKELDIDLENAKDTNDAFQKIFKNPSNLMNVVKNVGDKLDGKIKSGEIKESEILAEGMELLNNMKNMPGMENMQNIFSAMGMGGAGQKMNHGATTSRLQQNLKMAQMRERMRKKQEQQTQQQQSQQQQQQQQSQQQQQQQQEIPIPLPSSLENVGISSEAKKKKKKSKK